jgi:hypothetical protein
MLVLKILFQIGVGLTSLLAVLLDYKWHDKRKKVFKRFRNILIWITAALLLIGVAILVQDENQKDTEIKTLNNQLDTLKLKLTNIQTSSDSVNYKITPFLKLATERYPNLTAAEALDSLKREITNLNSKTTQLETFEASRRANEQEFVRLKNTPPSINVSLIMDKKRTVAVGIKFLNQVPIKFSYRLQNYTSAQSYSDHNTGEFELYPPTDNRTIYIKDDFNFRDNLRNEDSKLKLTVYYQSIYYIQSMNPALRGSKSEIYNVDPQNNVITKTN